MLVVSVKQFFLKGNNFRVFKIIHNFAEKTFAFLGFQIFKGINFRENGQNSRKTRNFLPAKVSALKVSTFSCLKFLKIGSQEVKSSKNTQFVDSTLPVTIKSFSSPLIFARLPTPLIFKRIKCGRERGAQTIKVAKSVYEIFFHLLDLTY